MDDDEKIDYNENNYEEDYNIDEIDNDIKNNNKIIEYAIIPKADIMKERYTIIKKFMEYSCFNYEEAELVLINYNWNYDKLIEIWYDETEKIKLDSHIEQSPKL